MKKFLVFLCLSFLSFFSFTNSIFAAGSVYLNPASGSITKEGTAINIVVDTGGQEFHGGTVEIKYEGEISLESISSGNIPGCNVEKAHEDIEKKEVWLNCFIDMAGDAYIGSSGVFATLNFKAAAEGTAKVSLTNVDVGYETSIGPVGEYRATLTSAPSGSGMGSADPTVLPEASLLNFWGIFVGLFFVLVSFFFFNSRALSRNKITMVRKLKN